MLQKLFAMEAFLQAATKQKYCLFVQYFNAGKEQKIRDTESKALSSCPCSLPIPICFDFNGFFFSILDLGLPWF